MTDTTRNHTQSVLQIKVNTSSLIRKLETWIEIKNSWEIDDANTDFEATDIGLQCEYAISELEELYENCSKLLQNPPSYEHNPDEKHHQLLEIHLLGSKALEYAMRAGRAFLQLMEEVYEGEWLKSSEAGNRMIDIRSEAKALENMTKKISEVDEDGE